MDSTTVAIESRSSLRRPKGKIKIGEISAPVENSRLGQGLADEDKPPLSPYFFPKVGLRRDLDRSDTHEIEVIESDEGSGEGWGMVQVVEFGIAVGDDRLSMLPDNTNGSRSTVYPPLPITELRANPYRPSNKRSTLRLAAIPAALHRIRHSTPTQTPTPSSPIGPPSPLTAINPADRIPPGSPTFAFGGLLLSIPSPVVPLATDEVYAYPPGPAPTQLATSTRPVWTSQPSDSSGTGLLRTLSARATLHEMIGTSKSSAPDDAAAHSGPALGPIPTGHRPRGSDWVLADALAASPTRFNFPASVNTQDRLGGRPPLGVVGHHELVQLARVSAEGEQPTRGRWRMRRKAQNLKPVVTAIAREAGPATAPPRQTEWLGPVRPSLLEPRFSSTRVLADVFRAVQPLESDDSHHSRSSSSDHHAQSLEPHQPVTSANESLPVPPAPASAPATPSRHRGLRRFLSSRSLKSSAASPPTRPPLPPASSTTTDDHLTRSASGSRRGPSSSVSNYAASPSAGRAPGNRLRKPKPAPTEVRESGRSLITRGATVPSTGGCRAPRSKPSRSPGRPRSKSDSKPGVPFGQGYGVGFDEDSPGPVPPLPGLGAVPSRLSSFQVAEPFPRQIPSPKNCTKRSEMQLSPLPFGNLVQSGELDPFATAQRHDFPTSLGPSPFQPATVPSPPGPSVTPGQGGVYPLSSGLWAALGLPSDGEQPVQRSRSRLKKSSSSSRATVEKVEEWLGAVTPVLTAVPRSFVESEGVGRARGWSVVESELEPGWGVIEQAPADAQRVLALERWRRSPSPSAGGTAGDVPGSPGGDGEVIWAGAGAAEPDGFQAFQLADRPTRSRTETASSTRSFGAAPHKRRTINSLTTLAPFRLAEAPGGKRWELTSRPATSESQQTTLSRGDKALQVMTRSRTVHSIRRQDLPQCLRVAAPLARPGATTLVAETTGKQPGRVALESIERDEPHRPVDSVPVVSRIGSSASVTTQPSMATEFTASSSADEGLFFVPPGGGPAGVGGLRVRNWGDGAEDRGRVVR